MQNVGFLISQLKIHFWGFVQNYKLSTCIALTFSRVFHGMKVKNYKCSIASQFHFIVTMEIIHQNMNRILPKNRPTTLERLNLYAKYGSPENTCK